MGLGVLGGISLFGGYFVVSNLDKASPKKENDYKAANNKDKDPEENEKKKNTLDNQENKKVEEEDERKEGEGKEKDKESGKDKEKTVKGLPYRVLGDTGEEVSLFALGTGAGAIPLEKGASREDAYEMIHRAIDKGVNYIDTAPTYAGGVSEENTGQVMKKRRHEVILATKTQSRDYDGVMRDIESSLNRLETDYIDVYQLHGISNDEDLNLVFARGGAVEALEDLKAEGIIRCTGVTGHNKPKVLFDAICEYDFDCLLMPLNSADIHSRPFQKELLDKAVNKQMGIIAMKVAAYGRLLREDGISNMKDALNYVYSFPISTAIVGVGDIRELEENIDITKNYEKLTGERLSELEGLTAHYQYEANFFKYEW